MGQIKYIAGSVYPFRWFNAGDFGSNGIVNADVEQVFQSAIYFLNQPPPGSDFFDGAGNQHLAAKFQKARDFFRREGEFDHDEKFSLFLFVKNICGTYNPTCQLVNNRLIKKNYPKQEKRSFPNKLNSR